MKRLLVGLIVQAMMIGQGISQVIIDPSAGGGFEAGNSFALNGWTVVNDVTNKWEIGTAAVNSGTNAVYISNDGGITNVYDNTVAQVAHFYSDVSIPAGATNIVLSFYYKGDGEISADQLSVSTASTSVSPVAGSLPAGALVIFTQPMGQALFTQELINLPATLAGTTTRLIFTWENNDALGSDPPVAIDDISLTYVPCTTVGTPSAISILSGSEPSCQLTNGTTTTTYGTAAADATGFNWSLSNAAAGTIDPVTGMMTWANGFFGTVDIQVSANGCNGPSAQVTRTVNITQTVGTPSAISIFSGSEPACQLTNGSTTTGYSTTAANATSYNWTLSNAAAGLINSSTGLMTWTNGFFGTVDIQVNANGCNSPSAQVTRTVNITQTVGTPSAISIFSGSEPACQLTNGSTTTGYSTTAANATSYNWTLSNAAAGLINSSTGLMTWANGFFGTVDIQVSANGCNGPSAQVTRTVNITQSVSSVSAISGTAVVCPGTTALTYSVTPVPAASFYNWTLPAGWSVTGGTNTNAITVTSGAAGQNGNIGLTVGNACGSVSAIPKGVSVNAIPSSLSVNPASTAVCIGSGTSLTGAASTSSTGSLINDNFNVTPGFTGSGSSSGDRSQVWKQASSGTTVLTIGPFTSPFGGKLMVATAGSSNILGASSANTQLTSASINTTAYASLTLTYNHTYKQGNSGSPSGTVQVSTNGGGSWTTLVTYNSNVGTSTGFVAASLNLNAFINAASLLIRFNFVTSNQNVLSNNTSWWAVDDVVLSGTLSPLFSWTANTGAGVNGLPPNAGTPLASNKTITVAPTATTVYSLTAQDALLNCPVTLSPAATVTVNPLPVPTISGPATACLNVPGNIYTTEAGKTNYVWVVTGGTVTAGGGTGNNTATVTWTSGGSRSISVNYTALGCSAASPTVYAVIVNGSTPVISGPNTACLNSTGNVYSVQAGKSNYSWSVTGGIITAGGGAADNTVTVTWTSSGNQTVSANYTDAGCTAPVASSYPVAVSIVAGAVATPASQAACSGVAITTITLSGTGTLYSWTRDNTATVTGIASSGTGNISGSLSQSTGSAITVTFTITPSVNGCPGPSITATVLVNPLPAIFNVTGGGTYCAGGSGVAIGLSGSETGVNYQLKRGATNVILLPGTGAALNFGSQATTGTYTVVATNTTTNCPAGMNGSATVSTYSLPVANAGPDQLICSGTTTIGGSPAASGGTPGYSYAWSAGVSNSSIANPSAPAGTYTLTVTDANGCSKTDAITVATGGGVKNWVGDGAVGATGPDNNFNNPLNWSPAGVPGACNDVRINVSLGSIFSGGATLSITLAQDVTINSLQSNFGGVTVLSLTSIYRLDVGTHKLTVLTTTSMANTVNVLIALPAYNEIGVGVNGTVIYGGNLTTTTSNNNFNLDFPFYATTNNSGRFYVNGNANLAGVGNDLINDVGNKPAQVIFDGTTGSTQTITNSNNTTQPIFLGVTSTDVGEANSPIVVLAGTGSGGYRSIGNLNVNNTSTLDVGTTQTINRNGAGGSLILAAGSLMKLGKNSGGVGASNFPSNYTTMNLHATSTVEYNATTAQTVYATPVYGNLTVSNNSVKTAGGPLTLAGSLRINPTATFAANGATGWTHNVAGDFTNNGTFSYVAGTTNVFNFNGNNNATISGTSATGFYSITVNKGADINTILNVQSAVTTANSPAQLTFSKGLLRIQGGGSLVHNGSGPTIPVTSGLHVNGGNFQVTNASVINDGLVRNSSGASIFGTTAGNELQTRTGGSFEMTGGTLSVGGRIRNTAGTFNMSGGTITVCAQGNISTVLRSFEMSLTTNMNITGGIIQFRFPNTAATPIDDIWIKNGTGTKSVTGGEFLMGTTLSPAGAIFNINSEVPLYDLEILNSNSIMARLTNQLDLLNNLTIGSTSSLDAATNNKNISLGGQWVNNGNFSGGNFPAQTTSVTFNGNIPQTISGAAAVTTFNNLRLSNTGGGITLLQDVQLIDDMNFDASNVTLNTNNRLTIRSTAANTGSIGDITGNGLYSGNGISGKVTVERYVPGHRAWRLMAAPLAPSLTTISEAWQEGAVDLTLGQRVDPHPGYGTHITGGPTRNPVAVGNTGGNGFDAGPNKSSIYTYSGTSWSVIPANTSTTLLTDNPGYMLFVRGNRSTNLSLATAAPFSPAVLRPSGPVYTGDKLHAFTGAAGFKVVGNPYAAAFNYLTTAKNGTVSDYYYTWDPLLTGGYGVGGFITLSPDGFGGFVAAPDPGIVSPDNSNPHTVDLDGSIQSGSAFIIYYDGGNGDLTIHESDKKSSSDNKAFSRPLNAAAGAQMRIDLYDNDVNGRTMLDGVLLMFDEAYFNDIRFTEDAKKINNFAENISIYHNGQYISIEKRKPVSNADTIFLSLYNLKEKSYNIDILPLNIYQPGMLAFLEDGYSKQRRPLDLTIPNSVPLVVDANPASKALNRLRIVFEGTGTVPVVYSNIRAWQIAKDIMVEWKVENQVAIDHYIIQRSLNGIDFTAVNTMMSKEREGAVQYNWLDIDPGHGIYYYRIVGIERDGRMKYSKIVKLQVGGELPSIVIHPNPVTGKAAKIIFNNIPAGNYQLALYNADGQNVWMRSIDHDGRTEFYTIPLYRISQGVYELVLTDIAGNRTTAKMIITH